MMFNTDEVSNYLTDLFKAAYNKDVTSVTPYTGSTPEICAAIQPGKTAFFGLCYANSGTTNTAGAGSSPWYSLFGKLRAVQPRYVDIFGGASLHLFDDIYMASPTTNNANAAGVAGAYINAAPGGLNVYPFFEFIGYRIQING